MAVWLAAALQLADDERKSAASVSFSLREETSC